jgi:hypothetical protein
MSLAKALELASNGLAFDEQGKKVEAISFYEEARREVRKCTNPRDEEEVKRLKLIDARCIERLAILDPVLKDGLAPLREVHSKVVKGSGGGARSRTAADGSGDDEALRAMRAKLDSLSAYQWLDASAAAV